MALPFSFKAQTIIAEGKTSQIAVDTIRDWLQTTSLPLLQDEFIVIFLISSENKIDKAKQIIEAYFRIKNGYPKIFNNIDLNSEPIKNIQKVAGVCILPNRIDNKSVVVFGKLTDTNYRNVQLLPAIKLAIMYIHMVQIDDPPSDIVAVVDMEGVGFMHLTCIKMDLALAYLKFIQEALPLKIRAAHVLNTNYIFYRGLNLFKRFINSEILKLVHPHPSGMKLEKFHEECVPASCLPKEYGGEIPFEQLVSRTQKESKKMQSFLDAEEKFRKCL
ncbi:alpha-tocopherol transfer protein-like [Zophobas morio]